MRVVLYSKGLAPFQSVACGFETLGHRVFWRNPGPFDRNQVERCDLVVVGDSCTKRAQICDVYGEREIPVIVVGQSGFYGADYHTVRYSIWPDVPEVECPDDRARAQGLVEARCRRNGALVFGPGASEPLARLDSDEPLQPFLNRVAYGQWTAHEMADGAPFRFLLAIMDDAVPFAEMPDDAPAFEPAIPDEPEAPAIELETAPADDAPTPPLPTPAISDEEAVKRLWGKARKHGMRKAELREAVVTRGANAMAAYFQVDLGGPD